MSLLSEDVQLLLELGLDLQLFREGVSQFLHLGAEALCSQLLFLLEVSDLHLQHVQPLLCLVLLLLLPLVLLLALFGLLDQPILL